MALSSAQLYGSRGNLGKNNAPARVLVEEQESIDNMRAAWECAWLGYFMSDFRILVRHGIAAECWTRWVGFGLIWLAVAIMLVGIFKSNLTPFDSLMHNLAAYSLAVIFGLLMAGSRWSVPGFPREFHLLSWIVLASPVGTLIWSALCHRFV